MPIPTSLSYLSQTAADNYPTGSEVIGANLDNYLRAHASFIKSQYSLASSSITAASSVDVSASDGESVLITGQATITSLGTGYEGCKRELRFDDTCTLTHSSNLVLPGGDDLSTSDGDVMTFRCTGSGVWVYVSGSTGSTASAEGTIPQVVMTANRDLALTDAGCHRLRSGGDLTIKPDASVASPVGSVVTVVNDASTSMTLYRDTGVTLRLGGNSASVNLTLVGYGVCTLLKTATDTWYASGSGLS